MERQKTFDENIELLSEKLREVASDKDKLETELSMTHRKYEFSMLEQKDQVGSELQVNKATFLNLENESYTVNIDLLVTFLSYFHLEIQNLLLFHIYIHKCTF